MRLHRTNVRPDIALAILRKRAEMSVSVVATESVETFAERHKNAAGCVPDVAVTRRDGVTTYRVCGYKFG